MGEDVDFCVVPVNPLPVVPNLFGLLDAHRQSPLEEPDSRASIGRVAHEEGCVNRAFRLVPGRARPIWITRKLERGTRGISFSAPDSGEPRADASCLTWSSI